MRLARTLLFVAAADSLAAGGWAVLRPGSLFALLAAPAPADALSLWRLLGVLLLGQGVCLIAAAWRPGDCGSLVVVALCGRLLLCGVWLWLLGTPRVRLPPVPLRGLLLHDAVWLPVFLGILWACRSRPETPAA
jgi:hypothetical protein